MTVRNPPPPALHGSTYFDQFYRLRPVDGAVPFQERFAGANVRLPDGVSSVLDVGCGDGEFLRWLSPAYWQVGLDRSIEALRRARGRVVQGGVEALPFRSASFDLVTCFEVLEHLHVESYRAAISELERVSRAHIIIGVPNRERLMQSLVWCPQCCCAFNASWHVRTFDEAVLAGLFSHFTMVECRACGPEARYGGRLADWLVPLARRRAPRLALCPQCGYSDVAAPSTGGRLGRRIGGALRAAARRMLFRDRRPYWLVASYVRKR